MKKALKWIFLLSKRLYKKASFVILLLLIPVTVVLLSLSNTEKTGFLHIALTCESQNDALSNTIISELSERNSLIKFTVCKEKNEALDLINTGKVDSVWLFPDKIEEKIEQYLDDKSDAPIVKILEREDNVTYQLSREVLAGALYKHCARAEYIHFIRTEIDELSDFSDEYLETYYDEYEVIGELFSFHTPYSSDEIKQTSYVLTPIRGILSVLLVIGALAATLYFRQDEIKGTYSLIPLKRNSLVLFANQIITCLNLSVVLLLSAYFAGVTVSLLREIISLLLFIIASCAFGQVVSALIKSTKLLAVLTPFLIVIMTVACPVFMEFKTMRPISVLFPPTYYLNSLYNNKYFVYTLIYIALCFVVSTLIKMLTFTISKNKRC